MAKKYYIQKLVTLDDYPIKEIEGKNKYLLYEVQEALLKDIRELQVSLDKVRGSLDKSIKGSFTLRIRAPLAEVIDSEQVREIWERQADILAWVKCREIKNIYPIDHQGRPVLDEGEGHNLREVKCHDIQGSWGGTQVFDCWAEVSFDERDYIEGYRDDFYADSVIDKDSMIWFRLVIHGYKTLRFNLKGYLKEFTNG